MPVARSTAAKLSLKDIDRADFFRGEGKFEPNYIITQFNEKASRVRVMGIVVSKFISEDRKYAAITLDDTMDTIDVRVFMEIEPIQEIELGETLDVIGKVKEYQEKRYIAPEILKKIDNPNWEIVRKMEMAIKEKKLIDSGYPQNSQNMGDLSESGEDNEVRKEIIIDEKTHEIMKIIEQSDEGDGVKYVTLLKESKIDDDMLEDILNQLLGNGDIYEPKIGRFKRV